MIFLPLILAHLLGDFILQPNSWVADKERNKTKSKFLYIHVFIHSILAFLFLWNLEYWWIALIVGVSHFIIDAAKLHFQKTKNKRLWFFIDQFLHVAVILGISVLMDEFDWALFYKPEYLPIITAAIFLTTPTSTLIRILLSTWTPVTLDHSKLKTESLTNAGKYIGILERLLVFTLIVMNHWEGVGFMIAAKSVFRFSDLAEAKQRKLTEYVLIGTLLSFGLAILTGILIQI